MTGKMQNFGLPRYHKFQIIKIDGTFSDKDLFDSFTQVRNHFVIFFIYSQSILLGAHQLTPFAMEFSFGERGAIEKYEIRPLLRLNFNLRKGFPPLYNHILANVINHLSFDIYW